MSHHGRRHIAFLGGPAKNLDAQVRFEVYREGLARHGIRFDPGLVMEGNFTHPSAADGLGRMIDRGVRFDAVMAANDGMAIAHSTHSGNEACACRATCS